MGRSLSQALAREFSARTRIKGDEYLAMNRVRVESSTASTLTAVAMGTRPYRVSIERRERAGGASFVASCDCPYFREEFTPCKHLWATLCLADRAGHLGSHQPMPQV